MKIAITLLLTFSICTPSIAGEWGPWDVQTIEGKSTESAAPPLQLAVKLFQKYISPVDGPRCPMYPTCSSYSLQALRQHGPWLGVFQTVDRLYREGDSQHEHSRPVAVSGYIRFSDPLENNDFWLKADN